LRILGVDPGTVVMGYGLLDTEDDNTTLVKYGALRPNERFQIGERLNYLYTGLLKIIKEYKPDILAVEQPFVAKNVKAALSIGRAQAIAILAAANRGLPLFEYTPAQVKQRVANYGASSKEQIQEMVKLSLGLTEIPEPNDAADALAVALCHIQEMHLNRLLADSK
jgi:crossover junction endodeoxyribonuclease RuvC